MSEDKHVYLSGTLRDAFESPTAGAAFRAYVLARLAEPSTWRGIMALLTSVGLAISPEQAVAITSVGIGLIGLIGTFVPDKTKG